MSFTTSLARVALLAAVLTSACSHVTTTPGPHDATVTEELAPSIYDLKVQLQDQSGREIGLDLHRGHPVLVAMFYASCPNACPLLIADLKALDAKLETTSKEHTRFLLVSFDPKVDTVASLAEAMSKHELDSSRWTLARTSEESVRDLAAVLDLKFRFLPDGNINHSSAIVLLDADGRAAGRIEGLKQPPEPLLQTIRALVE